VENFSLKEKKGREKVKKKRLLPGKEEADRKLKLTRGHSRRGIIKKSRGQVPRANLQNERFGRAAPKSNPTRGERTTFLADFPWPDGKKIHIGGPGRGGDTEVKHRTQG